MNEDLRDARQQVEHLHESIDEFQKKSGVSIQAWNAGDIGEAVQIVLAQRSRYGEGRDLIASLERSAEGLRKLFRVPPEIEVEEEGSIQ